MDQTMVPSAPPPGLRSALGDQSWSVSGLVDEIRATGVTSAPFGELNVAFCHELSRELMALHDDPDAVSLGFWLRPASVARTQEEFETSTPSRVVVVPRGLAFHLTPANVHTVFVYSWILSLLAGNSNIVRISSRSTEARSRLLSTIGAVISQDRFSEVAQRNRIVMGGRDDEVSMALSTACDLRVIWGGNATVDRFRMFPISPQARDVVFPDRHSLAIIDADAVAGLADAPLARLADQFFGDAFWYDQGACSSPRLIVWRASSRGDDVTERVRERFHAAVSRAVNERGYVAETGAAINKMATALDRAARSDDLVIDRASNEITWVRLPDASVYDRDNCGGGLFFEFVSSQLEHDLIGLVRREDQTAACFGIDGAELRGLAGSLNGRGIDRFVPMGQALAFDSLWDGFDLLREFTRRVVVDVG